MKKCRTINLKDIWNVDVSTTSVWHDGSFVLEILNKDYLIRVHFEGHYISAIAHALWAVVRKQKGEISERELILRGEG